MSRNYASVALPFDGTLKGFVTPKDDIDVIKTAVIMIVLTQIGERVMLDTFGTIVPHSAFDPMDEQLKLDLEESIRIGLLQFEDRAQFDSVSITYDTNSKRTEIVVRVVNTLDPTHQEIQEIRVAPELVEVR